MSLKRIAGAALFASACVVLAQPAWSASTTHKHHGHAARRTAAAAPQQIACTVIGCMPIPAACTPVAGKTPGGRPTGFDVIVCPPGVWPLK
jgi:hypothetical protein